jgi:hypothetical protein
MLRLVLALIAIVAAGPVFAQHSPYVGMEGGELPALTDRQIADLRAGRGMALALAAELNSYPGPMHVLELSGQLQLSDEQRTRVGELVDAMRLEAVPLGEKLIAQEMHLDRLFASRIATEEALAVATRAIGETQGALRLAHLRYHVRTAAILTLEQITAYDRLRGYGMSRPHAAPPH